MIFQYTKFTINIKTSTSEVCLIKQKNGTFQIRTSFHLCFQTVHFIQWDEHSKDGNYLFSGIPRNPRPFALARILIQLQIDVEGSSKPFLVEQR